eukprot:TRINITY_DN21981_c0_g1_i1.p1 TRINITY_DN21981_c0_g1~~TRINITY_DN21981_c0_g1_i1.p1  ORF type:complete len:148 (-),score=33.09 TRINITY_DN21981_c0_g1_i1:34-477(-)
MDANTEKTIADELKSKPMTQKESDKALFFIIGVFTVMLLLRWPKLGADKCDYPINIWLLFDFASIVLGVFIGRNKTLMKYLSVFIAGFALWTIVGQFFWFFSKCSVFLDVTPPNFSFVWLFINYFLLFNILRPVSYTHLTLPTIYSV